MNITSPTVALLILHLFLSNAHAAEVEQSHEKAVTVVTSTPGLVAFWDFVQREPEEPRRFIAHVPHGQANRYPLDAANYVKDYWGAGRAATYKDFPQLGRGPFGNAIRIVKESDPNFRPFLYVPRARLHDTPLDIKGAGKSVSVVVWAIRESGNHALAGIWHEGTDLKQQCGSAATAFVPRVNSIEANHSCWKPPCAVVKRALKSAIIFCPIIFCRIDLTKD